MTDNSKPRGHRQFPAPVAYLIQVIEKQGIPVQYEPPTRYKDNYIREVTVQLTVEGRLAALDMAPHRGHTVQATVASDRGRGRPTH